MKPRTTLLTVAVLSVALAVCGDATGVDEPSPVGFWDIWSVDGQALPIAPRPFLEYTSGSLDIRANGSFVRRFRGSFAGEPFDETKSGDWTQTGATVFLNPSSGCRNTAVIERSDILKIDADCEEGWEMVYAR